jgi:hypothetical protein
VHRQGGGVEPLEAAQVHRDGGLPVGRGGSLTLAYARVERIDLESIAIG